MLRQRCGEKEKMKRALDLETREVWGLFFVVGGLVYVKNQSYKNTKILSPALVTLL